MTTTERRPPGRPRSEQARRAVLSATLALAAAHGPRGLRMDAIARRAGVSKETLYRWWRSKTELVLEALAEQGEQTIPLPDTGSLAGDLRAFLRATVASADQTTQRLLRALAAEAAADPAMAQLIRDRLLARRRAALNHVLERAVQRRELSRANAATTLDLIYGSLWYRIVFEVGPLDNPWANSVARTIASTGTVSVEERLANRMGRNSRGTRALSGVTTLAGSLVRLRPPTRNDLPALAAIRRTPEVHARWSGGNDTIAAVTEDLDEPDSTPYVIELAGRVVGWIQWSAADEPDYRYAAIDIYLDPAVHGRGLGSDAVRTLARHLINDHGYHRLEIDPARDNEAAIHSYMKVGFQPVGIRRRSERGDDGTWHDVLLMDLLAEELVDEQRTAAGDRERQPPSR